MRLDRLPRVLLLALLTTLLSSRLYGYSFDYSGMRAAELLPCDRYLWRGQAAETRACFSGILAGEDPFLQAEAAWALGNVRQANQLFGRAVAADPGNPHIRTRWGYLYIQTWQYQDAIQFFREALNIDADYQPARIGLAAALTSQFRGEVQNEIYNILEDNPDNIRAMLIMAKLALERRDTDGARPYLDQALELVNDSLPPLEAYAMLASADYLDGNLQSPWIARALDYNPGYGDLFVTLAYFAEITYQYRQAVAFLERGIEVEADNWTARSALGINLSRINRLDEAEPHLQYAYQGDPYNVETVNMLRLLDSMDRFLVLEHRIEFEAMGDLHSAQVQLRLHRDEVAFMEPYVIELLERGIPLFAERYQFIPREPIVIEIYPNHDDFAVRTVGTPGVGLLGVAFGYLFALDSPADKASGEFHWGNVLWHELAHVFSLEASGNRTSRWFSEGLSVFEEWHSGPVDNMRIPAFVFEAIRRNRLLPVADLDRGFMRPTYENQIMVSYVQAGLVCTFIAEQWGDQVLAAMLRAYRDRLNSREVIETVLDIRAAVFDRQFDSWLKERFGPVLDQYDEWTRVKQSIGSAMGERNWPQVVALSNRSLAIYPTDTEGRSPWIAKALALRELGDAEGERQALEDYYRYRGYDPDMLSRLVQVQLDQGDRESALEVQRALRFVTPHLESLHQGLASNYLATGRAEEAIREYNILLAMDVYDKPAVHLGMARAYLQLDDPQAARRQVLRALEIAPHFREAQQLLFQLTNQQLTNQENS